MATPRDVEPPPEGILAHRMRAMPRVMGSGRLEEVGERGAGVVMPRPLDRIRSGWAVSGRLGMRRLVFTR